VRKQALALLEEQSQKERIDLYYADESGVSSEGYVPYGWQFSDESACIASAKGQTLNCFALIWRKNQISYAISQQNITADFIIRQFDELSLTIEKPTVVVMDNAKVHTAAKIKLELEAWQKRGLFIFYLPPYSPHLNIAERLWKELKARWLRPEDYRSNDQLFYAVKLALAAVGKELFINLSDFQL
jgi:transposase